MQNKKFDLPLLKFIWSKGDGAKLQSYEIAKYHPRFAAEADVRLGQNLATGLKRRGLLVSRPGRGTGYAIALPPGETAEEWRDRVWRESYELQRQKSRRSSWRNYGRSEKYWAAWEVAARHVTKPPTDHDRLYNLVACEGYEWHPTLRKWVRRTEEGTVAVGRSPAPSGKG